jgi:hypothetical protein
VYNKYFNEEKSMRDYEDREPDLDAMDQRAEELYDEHRDALAHLPTEIFTEVNHLPTAQAIALGGQLLLIKRQADMNKAIADSIWGER